MKILNEISKFNTSKIYLSLETLKQLSDDAWWEIKAQILIICSNQLEFMDSNREEK